MVQSVALWQSMGLLHPPAGQSILQAMPIGHLMAPLQGEHSEPQANVQTPFSQEPPAVSQARQGPPASIGPQVGGMPASTPRPPDPAADPAAPPRPPPPNRPAKPLPPWPMPPWPVPPWPVPA